MPAANDALLKVKRMYKYTVCQNCNGTGKEIDDTRTGETAKYERESAKVSLRGLARACGWSAAYISDLENGRRRWNEIKMTRYVEALEKLRNT